MLRYSHQEKSPLQSGRHRTAPQPNNVPQARDHIRILRLFPGEKDAPLEGNIIIQPIVRHDHKDDPVRDENKRLEENANRSSNHADAVAPPGQPLVSYEALSYNWGNQAAVSRIKIVADDQSFYVEIRPNLEHALRQLRHRDRVRNLWIDAISVDQSSKEEKSDQVPQMSWIYHGAENVVVWLGDEANGSKKAIEFVRDLLKLDDFDQLVRDPKNSENWAALAELMRRPWFSRRWIIQEIAVAKKAILYCGADHILWRDFADGVSLFASKRRELREIFRESSAHSHHPDYLGEISELGAIRLVWASDNLFRKDGKGKIVEHLLSLEALMSSMSAFEASDPHDYLYAIMWLSNDARPVDPNAPLAQGIRPHQLRSPESSPEHGRSLVPVEGSHSNGENDTTSPEQITTESNHSLNHGSDPNKQPVSNSVDEGIIFGEPSEYHKTEGHRLSQAQVDRKWGSLLDSLVKQTTFRSVRNRQPALDPEKALITAGKMFKQALKDRNIFVDYSKSVFEVCRDFLQFVFRRTKRLDMICRPWAPDDEDLPSWIPPLARGAFAPGVRRVHRRVHGDALVGDPGNGLRPYRASGIAEAEYVFDSNDGRVLKVKGYALASIEVKSLPASSGTIPKEWLAVGGWNDTKQLPPDAFWRTLVGNRTVDGKLPPSHWQRVCREAFERRPSMGNLMTSEVILYDCPSVVRDFLERVQCVVWSRRLVRLDKLPDSPALVPADAKKGDLICILNGCSVPVVLRHHINGEPVTKLRPQCMHRDCPSRKQCRTIIPGNEVDDIKRRLGTDERLTEHYKFIGEAYVHGMMDGEAHNWMRDPRHQVPPKMFPLK